MPQRVTTRVDTFHGNMMSHHYFLQQRKLTYRFETHFHPYVDALTKQLLNESIAGLQAMDTKYEIGEDGSFETLPVTENDVIGDKKKFKPELYKNLFHESKADYTPNADVVEQPYPVMDLDFRRQGAYSVYNWELFFHIPITIAIHLSKNQRYEDAQKWFHYIFDPTDDSDGPTPERFWKVRPFHYTDVKRLEEIFVNLVSLQDSELLNDTTGSLNSWLDNPFRPHVIARGRQQAYMLKTVMAYLDNLIAWGDSLFRQDTGESIDEALMLYVLAAGILGPKPQEVPKKGKIRPQTYANLRKDLKRFGTVLREVEADVPFDLLPMPTQEVSNTDKLASIHGLGKALYFCIPPNDKLLSYWDIVADRLFKIRNSLNIEGKFRQLALFEPPIDPGMLARAAAAGLDIGSIISGMNQPLPFVRFQYLIQKANEICQEVKSLGGQLLAAMEKEDGETLAILRAKQEKIIMGMVEHVKYAQLQEAIKSREGLFSSLELAMQRYVYYERQLGKKPKDIKIPELEELDRESLQKLNFKMDEPFLTFREIDVDIATGVAASAAKALNGGKIISSHEKRELLFMETAQTLSDTANVLNAASSTAHVVPTVMANTQPMGAGATTEYGGKNVGLSLSGAASALSALAGRLNFEASRASRIGSYARREQDWAFQSNLAAGEITQIFKQLRAAQIRECVAELELKNHRQQMKHAEEIELFLNEDGTERKGKVTNKSLYTWMKRETRGLYSQCFQLAFDIAKKAERALQHELGSPDQNFLQFNYQAGKEGLLAGEKLQLDIKRMDLAYSELNRREYELTKHVSLLQLDPMALIQLRKTGRCKVSLPEELFDIDGPGQYFRRIKTMAVSIPCVTGAYVTVNCKLTLLKSSVRKVPILKDGMYIREDSEDIRFADYSGSLQSIVTSSSQNDSGLFETNLRDERYLPFEGSGVISEWQLELPGNPTKKDLCQFDYDTISDVLLHMRYTARDGGDLLGQKSRDNINTLRKDGNVVGSVRLFSIRHEFPSQWSEFINRTANSDNNYVLSLPLKKEHYPFWQQDHLEDVKGIDLLVGGDKDKDISVKVEKVQKVFINDSGQATSGDISVEGNLPIKFIKNEEVFGNLLHSIITPDPDETDDNKILKPTDTLKLEFDGNDIKDIWMAVSCK